MNDPLPEPDRPLDRLVRARLERDADPARADELWRRAQRPRASLLAWVPRLAAAAVLVAVGLLFWPGGQGHAAAEVVRKAYEVHTRDESDRRYRLEVELPPAFKARFPGLAAGAEAELWTRGDRFRVEPGPAGGVWGQDGDGRVWLAPTPKAGARYDEGEIPDRLRMAMRVRAADLPELLTELQGTCELTYAVGTRQSDAIAARRVRGESSLSRADLRIDGRTGSIESLSVWRDLPGGEEACLRLTLQGKGIKPEAFYTLEGNLAPGGAIYDRSRSGKRLGLLLHHGLGAMLGK